jgi:hypothetical protein
MRNKAKTWGVIGTSKSKRILISSLHGGEVKVTNFKKPNPNCRPYSSPHQVPKHKMLWHIE